MTDDKGSRNLCIFSFDIGVNNMGFACISIGPLLPHVVVHKLDRRALPIASSSSSSAKKISPIDLIDGVRKYVTEIARSVDAKFIETDTMLVPDIVYIEQQVVMSKFGTNYDALKIQTILHTLYRERYPHCTVEIVGASARDSGGTKARAHAVSVELLLCYSSSWLNEMMKMKVADTQHIHDAVSMIIKKQGYYYMPDVERHMKDWDALNPVEKKTRGKKKSADE